MLLISLNLVPFHHINLSLYWNISAPSQIPSVENLSDTYTVSSSEQLLQEKLNILSIFVTFSVLKLVKSNSFIFLRSWNIVCIFSTLVVSKLLIFNVSNAKQLLNIDRILVTFSVLKLLKSKFFNDLQL